MALSPALLGTHRGNKNGNGGRIAKMTCKFVKKEEDRKKATLVVGKKQIGNTI
jgi:hypothetical protein